MKNKATIAVVGTFDSKAEEHLFLKTRIENSGLEALTIHVGTKTESPVPVDLDLYDWMRKENSSVLHSRDKAIGAMILEARARIINLYRSDIDIDAHYFCIPIISSVTSFKPLRHNR